jgi:hypothetical protein
LRGTQRGQQKVAAVPVGPSHAVAVSRSAADGGVDRFTLGVARLGAEQAEIHA